MSRLKVALACEACKESNKKPKPMESAKTQTLLFGECPAWCNVPLYQTLSSVRESKSKQQREREWESMRERERERERETGRETEWVRETSKRSFESIINYHLVSLFF